MNRCSISWGLQPLKEFRKIRKNRGNLSSAYALRATVGRSAFALRASAHKPAISMSAMAGGPRTGPTELLHRRRGGFSY